MHWLAHIPDDQQRSPEYSTVQWILENADLEGTSGRLRQEVASLIDHTLLKPDATPEDILGLCREAREYNFAGVCVHSSYIPICVEALHSSGVRVFSVAGFPFGATYTMSKAREAAFAVELGATEIDMVLHIGHLKVGDDAYVLNDIKEVVRAVEGRPVKVILETVFLSKEEITRACRLSADAGARFVKTATGFAGGGATIDDVALMRETVGMRLGVKAAGGIRSLADALSMIRAGASRIGTSQGAAIVADPES